MIISIRNSCTDPSSYRAARNELPRGRAREVSCLRKVIFQNQTLVVAQKFSRIFLDLQHNFEF